MFVTVLVTPLCHLYETSQILRQMATKLSEIWALTADKMKFCAGLTHRAVGYSFLEQSCFKNIRSGKVMFCRANCRTDFFNHHSLISTSLVSSKLVFTVVVKCVEQNFPNSLKVLVQSKSTVFPLVTLNDNTRKLINHTHLH